MASFGGVLRADVKSGLPFLVWGVMTVVLSISGPFGSYSYLSFSQRLTFWAFAVGLAVVISTTIRAFVYGVLGLRDFRNGAVLIAALVCVVLAWPMHRLVVTLYYAQGRDLPGLNEMALFVFSTSLGVGAFRHFSGHAGPPGFAAPIPDARMVDVEGADPDAEDSPLRPVDPAQTEAAPPPPRLLVRIEAELQGELLSISVRDHYVDVTTSKGRTSLLMRFSDAMAETEGVDGVQVHRSHWVAWQAVQGVARAEGKLFVTLAHGGRIPVSRNHRAKLEARGLI